MKIRRYQTELLANMDSSLFCFVENKTCANWKFKLIWVMNNFGVSVFCAPKKQKIGNYYEGLILLVIAVTALVKEEESLAHCLPAPCKDVLLTVHHPPCPNMNKA